MKINSFVGGLILAGIVCLAGKAQAGIIFGPTQPSFTAAPLSSVQIPFAVTLTAGQTSAAYTYAAFNFSLSGDVGLVQSMTFDWDPVLGGSQGPVTYSRFWATPLAQSAPELIFGTLTVNLTSLSSGTVNITPGQGSGPQWLWTGDCPSNPDMGSASITVPAPGSAALMGFGALLGFRRRRA